MGVPSDAIIRANFSHPVCNSYVFDFHAALPYHSLSAEDREKYWDDHVHLTADGYDFMGEKIAEALKGIMGDTGSSVVPATNGVTADSSPKRPTRRRRVFKDDDNNFVEETGDPTLIDQGYIVVRRKDLD